jgi:hypothetical protein
MNKIAYFDMDETLLTDATWNGEVILNPTAWEMVGMCTRHGYDVRVITMSTRPRALEMERRHFAGVFSEIIARGDFTDTETTGIYGGYYFTAKEHDVAPKSILIDNEAWGDRHSGNLKLKAAYLGIDESRMFDFRFDYLTFTELRADVISRFDGFLERIESTF